MFGIGLPEMIVILAVALIVVGPDKLPELARSLAKGVNELKSTLNQVKENLSEESKVINSVQEDLQKTAIAMKDNLLEDDAKIWRPEDALPDPGTDDSPAGPPDDIIEMEALAERPWEKDAAAEPVITESEQDGQDGQDTKKTADPAEPVKDKSAPDSSV